jgi:hypothetical protein
MNSGQHTFVVTVEIHHHLCLAKELVPIDGD